MQFLFDKYVFYFSELGQVNNINKIELELKLLDQNVKELELELSRMQMKPTYVLT